VAVRIVETSGPAETELLGAELAGELTGGDVVLLQGELGTGKTTLVRGAARALGVDAPVTSPSFSIGHRYVGESVTVSHLDMYRLESLQHEDPGLLDEYFGAGRIAFVEWPAQGGPDLTRPRLRISLEHARAGRRRIEVADG
jgi:tRNA threonylcarbamoyladenosine biosynthesis protein TsaE